MVSVLRSAAVLVALTATAVAQPSPDVTKEFLAGTDAFRLGHYDEAKDHLLKAKALDPKLPGPNRFLAAVAQAQQRWQDCIDASRLAIELNPRSGEIADTKKLYDECRASAGRAPYREELGESAAIAVVTSVPGAVVKVGGLNYGGTPLAPRPITAGQIEVDIEKQGWKPVHVSVNALAGIVTDIIVELEPDPNAQSNTDLKVDITAQAMGRLVVPADISMVIVDGESKKPDKGVIPLSPGTHTLEVQKDGHDPWRRRVRITTGGKFPIAPTFVPTAARERKQTLGLALVSGGIAVTAFGFFGTLQAGDAAAEARNINRLETSHPPAGQYTRQDFEDARDRANKWSLISNLSYGVGLATIGVGAIYLYLGGRERSDVPPPYAVTPVFGGAVVSRGVSW